MISMIFLALFPNLQNYHPTSLQKVFDFYEHGARAECEKEYDAAFSCIENINEQFLKSQPSQLYFWQADNINNYAKAIENSKCFKNAQCQEIVDIANFYNQSTQVLKCIFGEPYRCIQNEGPSAKKIDVCAKNPLPLKTHMETCSKPVIEGIQCSDDKTKCLSDLTTSVIEIDEKLGDYMKDRNQTTEKNIIASVIGVLLFSFVAHL
uniref:DUF19 domain-containing protein n=2 Tax=Caenorhabditis tropicalis TaxID=1561998 RepID=A0A1I7URL3_9PELO